MDPNQKTPNICLHPKLLLDPRKHPEITLKLHEPLTKHPNFSLHPKNHIRICWTPQKHPEYYPHPKNQLNPR